MRVGAWSNGGGTFGLRIGTGNRDRFFDPAWDEIQLEIEGQVHSIAITAGFWKHCPEVRDPKIREWLRSKGALEWPSGKPPKFELTHVDGNRFRLEE
jgi:hypothetical protein